MKKQTQFSVSEAGSLFEEATGVNFTELFPQAEEELPKLFQTIQEFGLDATTNIVTLKVNATENFDDLKQNYLVTPNDKKCKRVDPKLLTGAHQQDTIAIND